MESYPDGKIYLDIVIYNYFAIVPSGKINSQRTQNAVHTIQIMLADVQCLSFNASHPGKPEQYDSLHRHSYTAWFLWEYIFKRGRGFSLQEEFCFIWSRLRIREPTVNLGGRQHQHQQRSSPLLRLSLYCFSFTPSDTQATYRSPLGLQH